MRKNKKNSPIGTVLLVVLLFVLVAIAAVSRAGNARRRK